jgi:O-antigen ligase
MKTVKLEYLQAIFVGIIAFAIISPPLANLLEAILIIGCFFNRSVIEALVKYTQSVDFKIHASFIVFLLIGFLYPLVETKTYSNNIISWRKFLLLPIGYILFTNSQYIKDKAFKFIFYFIVALTILAMIYKSQLLFFFNENTIKFHIGSSSSEGMFVSVALAIGLWSFTQKEPVLGLTRLPLALLTFYLMAYIVMFTSGRSGYIAMFIVLTSMSLIYIKNLKKIIAWKFGLGLIVVATITVALLSVSKTSSDRINLAITEFKQSEQNSTKNIYTSVGQRLIFWKNTIDMLPQYFVFGVGTGGFQAAYTKQVLDKTGLDALITQDPHNQYLKILIEQGVIGLLLYLSMIIRVLIQSNKDASKFVLFSTVLYIWLITSLFNAHFSTFMEGTFIWAWMGLMGSYSTKP